MIDNPDAEKEEDSAQIWAKDEADARRRCDEIATSRSDNTAIVRVKGVQKLTKTPSKNGTYQFVCQLEIEHQ